MTTATTPAETRVFRNAEYGISATVEHDPARGHWRVLMFDFEATETVGIVFCPTEEMAIKKAEQFIAY